MRRVRRPPTGRAAARRPTPCRRPLSARVAAVLVVSLVALETPTLPFGRRRRRPPMMFLLKAAAFRPPVTPTAKGAHSGGLSAAAPVPLTRAPLLKGPPGGGPTGVPRSTQQPKPGGAPVASALRRANEVLAARSEAAAAIRCPFWRRRATDALEAFSGIVRFLAARHKSILSLVDLEQLASDEHKAAAADKALAERVKHRTVQEVAEDVRRDFDAHRYYVTGRLNLSIYADNALFDAPDPDTPVRGAAKFADALGGLFDARRSRCDLVDLAVVPEAEDDDASSTPRAREIVALWRLEGVLRLPWRPTVKAFVGETTYALDDEGLICSHVERWSIPVLDAFGSVVAPELAARCFGPPAPSTKALRDDVDFARTLIIRPRCPWFIPKFVHNLGAAKKTSHGRGRPQQLSSPPSPSSALCSPPAAGHNTTTTLVLAR